MFKFQKYGSSGSWEKDISWVVKQSRSWEKIYIDFKRQRKNLQLQVSKENALRKGRLGAYRQEEKYLEFIQAEENIKSVLVHVISWEELHMHTSQSLSCPTTEFLSSFP